MQEYRAYFRGKKVTLMGLGLLGRGVGDAAFLAECGAIVTVTDKKTEAELAASVDQLKQYSNITFHLGGHQLDDFTSADLVIKAAGVPLDAPEIAAAKEKGVQVAMSTALFAKFAREAGARIVGVTGTRGKSTVTQMINHSLLAAGRKTLLGGNVRGISTLAQIPEISPEKIVVLELDSWQLQGFGDLKMSPNVAVFTNLMPDHQNYYPSMEAYLADKAEIFLHQGPTDFLLIGDQCSKLILDTYSEKLKAQLHVVHAENLPAELNLRIPGEHNRMNAACALRALRVLNIADDQIKIGLESFEGVEGRLQLLREIAALNPSNTNKIKIYNDNNATTPEATIVALRALESDITLICGGSEKGLDLKELVTEIKMRTSNVIVLTHDNYKGSERLIKELNEAGVTFEEVSSLSAAVESAFAKTEKGSILFSPGFASFGMFKNEYDRNDTFLRLVAEL